MYSGEAPSEAAWCSAEVLLPIRDAATDVCVSELGRDDSWDPRLLSDERRSEILYRQL